MLPPTQPRGYQRANGSAQGELTNHIGQGSWLRVAAAQVEYARFVAVFEASQQTVPVVKAQQCPGCYGSHVGSGLPGGFSTLPHLTQPAFCSSTKSPRWDSVMARGNR